MYFRCVCEVGRERERRERGERGERKEEKRRKRRQSIALGVGSERERTTGEKRNMSRRKGSAKKQCDSSFSVLFLSCFYFSV